MSASSTPTAEPVRLHRQGEVGGDRRLADPALARGDRDDRPDPGRERVLPRRGAAVPARRAHARRGRAGPARPGAPRGRASAVSTAVTDSTPGRASTAASAALRSGSRRGPRSGSTSIAKPTLPSRTTTPGHHPERDDVAALVGIAHARRARRGSRLSVTAICMLSRDGGRTDRIWARLPALDNTRAARPLSAEFRRRLCAAA